MLISMVNFLLIICQTVQVQINTALLKQLDQVYRYTLFTITFAYFGHISFQIYDNFGNILHFQLSKVFDNILHFQLSEVFVWVIRS